MVKLSVSVRALFALVLVGALAAGLSLAPGLAQGPRWTPIGPNLTTLQQFEVDPGEPNIIYGFRGSLVKSNDRGITWRVPGGPSGNRLLLDPVDRQNLYVVSTTRGISLSRDGGASFTSGNEGFPPAVQMFAHDPAVSGRVYAADFREGLFVTEDHGLTWQPVGEGEARERLVGVWAHPVDSNILFVHPSRPSLPPSETGFYRSTDAGQTWERILDNSSFIDVYNIVGSAQAPERLYAMRENLDNEVRLYRSQDSGATWVPIEDRTDERWEEIILDSTTGEPRFVRAQRFQPNRSTPFDQGQILRSQDGGISWAPLPSAEGWEVTSLGGSLSALFTSLAAGGTMVSYDQGESWRAAATNLRADANQLITHPDQPGLIYTLNANSFGGDPYPRVTEDGGASWRRLNVARLRGASNFDQTRVDALALDPANPERIFVAGQRMFGSPEFHVLRSGDGGANWTQLGEIGDLVVGSGDESGWVARLAIDPSNSDRLVAAVAGCSRGSCRGGVYRSLNGGSNFERVLRVGDLFEVLYDPSDSTTLYAASGSNVGEGIFKSTDGGANWEIMNEGLPETDNIFEIPDQTAIQSLVINPRSPQEIYARPHQSSMYRSTDGAASWAPYQAGDLEIVSIAFHPTQPVRYAIDADGNVLRSRDQGASWQSISRRFNPDSFDRVFLGGREFLFFDHGDPDQVLDGLTRFPSPAWLFAPGDPSGEGGRFDSLAISNNSDFEVNLKLRQLSDGAPAGPAARSLPAGTASQVIALGPAGQLARLRSDLFEDTASSSWIELIADLQASAFFQYGKFDLSQLDGGVAQQIPSRRLVFPLVLDGDDVFRGQNAQTRIAVLNPGPQPVEVSFRYFPSGGANGASSEPAGVVSRLVAAGGSLDERASTLFGGDHLDGWSEVTIEEGDGILGFAVIEFPDSDTQLGFNGLIDTNSRRLFSAQFSNAPNALFTDLTLVNTSDSVRRVTVTGILDDGGPLADPVELVLQPRESLTREAGELFPGPGFVASLIAEPDNDGVTGTVVFGDPSRLDFAAALALEPTPFSEAVFSQVASVPGVFFTGLAFFYPDPGDEAPDGELQIEVYQADGQMTGEATRTLVPGQRLAVLVEELVPEARGQSGGYIVVRFTESLIAQMLYGAFGPSGSIRLFSAVPPVAL